MTKMHMWEYGEVTFLDHEARDSDTIVSSGTAETASGVIEIPEGPRLEAMNRLGAEGWLLREVQRIVSPGENAQQRELIKIESKIREALEGRAKPEVIAYTRYEMHRAIQKPPRPADLQLRDGKLTVPDRTQ